MWQQFFIAAAARDLTEQIESAERRGEGKIQALWIVSSSQRKGRPGGAPRRYGS